MSEVATALLRIEGLYAGYGSRTVLEDVAMEVANVEFVGVIGHNGAGKSTLLKVIAGFLTPRQGRVETASLDGEKLRVGLVPQGLSVFPRMTVAENLQIPEIAGSSGASLVPVGEVVDLFPILGERLKQAAGNLSGGEQRMLAIAMALRLKPHLLLLDEPSLGLAPKLAHGIMDAVDEARRRYGYAVIVVEQNLDILLRRTDRLLAVRQGRIVWEGTAAQIADTRALWEHF